MSPFRRIDAPDTVDVAISSLLKWQSEGWGLEYIDQKVKYQKITKKSSKLPTAVTLTIRLTPSR
jgi:hypothetical protein